MTSEAFALKWNDFGSNIKESFRKLRENAAFSDVTLISEDYQQFEAHRNILSAFSLFFNNILQRNNNPHPLIFMMGLTSKDLTTILDFIYHGETSVDQNYLEDFFALAKVLQIKGLMEHSRETEKSSKEKADLIKNTKKTITEVQNDAEEYEVEAVTDKRLRKGKTEYLVKWKGWDSGDNTWEPIGNLECHEMIEEYETTLYGSSGENYTLLKKNEPFEENISDDLESYFVETEESIEDSVVEENLTKENVTKIQFTEETFKDSVVGENLSEENETINQLTCGECGKKYGTTGSLRTHAYKEHKNKHIKKDISSNFTKQNKIKIEPNENETKNVSNFQSDREKNEDNKIGDNDLLNLPETQTIPKELAFPCNWCGVGNKTQKELIEHIKDIHKFSF